MGWKLNPDHFASCTVYSKITDDYLGMRGIVVHTQVATKRVTFALVRYGHPTVHFDSIEEAVEAYNREG